MTRHELTLRAGGKAGDGIASLGDTLARTCSRAGLHVGAYNHYQSVIRGGHVWYHVRARADEVLSAGDGIDVLLALDQLTIDTHARWMNPGGVILFDPDKTKVAPEQIAPTTATPLGIPLAALAKQHASDPIMRNTVGAGAALYLSGLPKELTEEMLRQAFKRKGDEVVASNINTLNAGYDFAKEHGAPLNLELATSRKKRLLMTGNDAIALGAVASGCRFAAQYPMTPASPIMHWIASHASAYNVIFKQAEDELAAINLAIGASYAGLPSMTATSGGGFSLMVEAFGQAGMLEVPLVVVEVQRCGPSTGLPTKTEQADLDMVKGASQGEFPRAIIAPLNIADCYTAIHEAFTIAERFQVPVCVLSDLYLGEHWETVDPEAIDLQLPLDRSTTILSQIPASERPYLRYKFTPDGVSPRVVPGVDGGQHVASTDEHDEDSTLIGDVLAGLPQAIDVRVRMMEKRMRKLVGIAKVFKQPTLWAPPGVDAGHAKLTVVCWGSTQRVVREAVTDLCHHGASIATLELRNLLPFPAATVSDLLSKAHKTMIIEGNYTGQVERLIREQTGLSIPHHYRKYDGEPFYPSDVRAAIKEVL